MNEQELIVAKIKESAYENVNKKLEEERKKIEDKINNELKDVEKCLQYIKNKMVYKIIGDGYSVKEYRLANENTFFEDYNKESRWDKGIKFANANSKPYEPLFRVNGESYYDIRYIIRRYEENFNDYSDRLNRLREDFNKIKEAASELIKLEPRIKNLIKQYEQVEIDESYLEESCEDDWLY